MKYIDLFAGIGGFHYGLDQVSLWDGKTKNPEPETPIEGLEPATEGNQSRGISTNSVVSGNPGKVLYSCVYSNEWDKYANSVYRRHYGECDNRDIRTVKASEIPDFDLLAAGFPCQAFSVAGKRGGFADTRGTLFFEIARIAKEKRPRLLLLENVKGLLNHEQGRTFGTILSALDEIGYDVQWEVLNSKNFGVPQNRERVYIVANLRGTPRPQVFPLTEADSGNDELELRHDPSRHFSPTIRTATGGYHTPTIRYPLKFLQRNQKNIEGDYAYTVDSVNTGGIKQGDVVRRLTPVECERLQGFPDNWTKYGADGEEISDTQRYKMCGNALTTNIVAEIGKRFDL